jgi:mono/diheme cytochrome c family protein
LKSTFFRPFAMLAALAASLCLPAHAADTSIAQQLSHWSTQAGQPGNAQRGQAFFHNRHGGEWSCSSCHGTPPTAAGRHASTGKTIDPLAPAANPRAFTESARVEKWFRRNCKDVLARECSPAEKADVLAYLMSLKPPF